MSDDRPPFDADPAPEVPPPETGPVRELYDDLFRMRLADVLVDYRKYAGFTQRSLAAASHVTQKTISSIESGAITEPWDQTLRQLAAALSRPDRMSYTTAEAIYAHLVEAKTTKPTVRQQAPAEAVILVDRLRAMDARRRRIAFKMIMNILNAIADLMQSEDQS